MPRTLALALALSVPALSGQDPQVFAPDAISLPGSHDDYISLAPHGREAVFTRLADGYRGGTLYLVERVDGRWQNVRVAPFSGEHQDSRASFSPDGRRIVFASNRPGPGREGRTDLDVWVVERTASGWAEPLPIGATVNTAAHETHPSLAANGSLYFVRRTSDSDIWMAPAAGNGFNDAVRLPEAVNGPRPDSHVFVDPAERFLLFAREEPEVGDDIYLSVRRDGTWMPAVKLAAPVNTKHYDYSAKVFGAELYFTRNGQWTGGEPADILTLPVSAVPELAAIARASGSSRRPR